MSYILEALKRAERERSMGQAPAASDVTRMPYPAAGADGARSRWLIVALVATLVAAIVVIAVLGHRLLTRPQTAVATVAPAPAAAAPSAPVRSAAAVPEPAPVPAREAPVKPAIAANDAINSLADVAPADAAPAPPATAAASGHARLVTPAGNDGGGGAAAAPRTVAPAIPASPPATAPGLAGTAADSAVGNATDDAAGDTSADSAAAAASPAVPSPPAEPTIPPGLHQLEGAFRAQFPDLNVAVHAYNPNRQQSFVIIDNHTYHEGEALPQGPVIDQIVPEGIVFDWKGRKVLYALNR